MDDRQDFVDVAMLDKFSAFHRKQLKIYGQMLDALFKAYRMVLDGAVARESLEAAEIKIDTFADMLSNDECGSLSGDEYLTVHTFLNTLHSTLGGKRVIYNGVQKSNAHELIMAVVSDAAFAWMGLREECRSDSKSATEKFWKEILWDLPMPSELYPLLAAEYARAREILTAHPEPPRS